MDKRIEILLGNNKNINSIVVDTIDRIELFNKESELMEYDVHDSLSASDVFLSERETNSVYRIYGKIEFMSMLNGLKFGYKNLEDFFLPQYSSASNNIANSFNFYLVKPAISGYTSITGTSAIIPAIYEELINENFENWITSSPSNYPIGWEVNVTPFSYVAQYGGNQANFVLFSGNTNTISIVKEILSDYGNMVFETKVNLIPNTITPDDKLILTAWSNNTIIYSIDAISGTTGIKQFQFYVSPSLPITKVTIQAIDTTKTINLEYFKLIKTGDTNTIIAPSNMYIRYFQVIATPNDFEIFPVGYSKNIYGEQSYAFSFRKDFDVNEYYDQFGFPLTELFLFAQYIPKKNGNNYTETMSATTWTTVGANAQKILYPTTQLITNDYIKSLSGDKIGDLISYNREDFSQTLISGQTVYISTQYLDVNLQSNVLVWNYNPFTPLRLRYFSNDIYRVNTGSTSYDDVNSIPEYATILDLNGNTVWRDILPQGYFDSTTNVGVDYPFVNKRRYLFANIIISIFPDITNLPTTNALSAIWFSQNSSNIGVNLGTTDDLNNIGKPCQ